MATDEPTSDYYTVLKFAPGEASVITELANELGQPLADAVMLAVRQMLAARNTPDQSTGDADG